jgi:hypothetical protein
MEALGGDVQVGGAVAARDGPERVAERAAGNMLASENALSPGSGAKPQA